ncbi:SIR2-like protein [Antricoccus suffuscus]|uniref:SIR2-like protein n=1 Tax=Antricoccus suffuscus TaxID=1629062 RepID=A0A2T0ZEN5_9ACTN|nr:SIR2 family protein [Antricoccus suffuscus]PRZ34819.1 SIR2-like protein [Antricoccus suffuscus]
MQHCPSPISTGVPPYAVALANRADLASKLVIYAGAGISLSQPTNLPTGAELAARIHMQLKGVFPVIVPIESRDLVAVADAVATLPGGEEALRQTSAKSADFKTARPGYAHKVLAHLMLEGAIDVITTNWDNCIERGAGEELLPVVTNDHDLADVTPPWVLKVHGCASRPDSLLVTSRSLDNPPTWVREQTHARLGRAVVVFIGIGDVAGYVKRRIEEAIHEVGSVGNIRIVAPDIEANWEDSQWKTVVPNLHGDHKIPANADLFMEQLAAAYITGRLADHSVTLSSAEVLATYLEAAKKGLLESDSLTVLQWARSVDINPQVGEPVLKSSELGKVLIALGHLAGDSARLNHNHIFETAQGPVEVLISTQTESPRRLIDAAKNRLHDHASRGEPHPLFVVAGGVGPIPKPDSLPDSIVGEASDLDIVDGPLALVPDVRHADEVIAS